MLLVPKVHPVSHSVYSDSSVDCKWNNYYITFTFIARHAN